MFDLNSYFLGLAVIITTAIAVWLASLVKRDVSIVDSLWPLLFLLAAITYSLSLAEAGPRTALVLVLVGVWAIRLFTYITWRNWGEAEDRRYQAIRANNEPNFEYKSIYIVFGLQGIIAWIVSLPLLAAIASPTPITSLDYIGIALWAVGMIFEAGGDHQLAQFKADPANKGQVMDRGLWRYSRHPNYFGNACIWWGLGLIAVAGGSWWSVVSAVMMTFLLLKISGVSLLEKDIGERRPAYVDYIARTSAFIPCPPKKVGPIVQQSNYYG